MMIIKMQSSLPSTRKRVTRQGLTTLSHSNRYSGGIKASFLPTIISIRCRVPIRILNRSRRKTRTVINHRIKNINSIERLRTSVGAIHNHL
jgi:hypothetical protein